MNIRTWVKTHTFEETMEVITSGGVIRFDEENFTTRDSYALPILQAAYIYFEVERERRSERAREAWRKRRC